MILAMRCIEINYSSPPAPWQPGVGHPPWPEQLGDRPLTFIIPSCLSWQDYAGETEDHPARKDKGKRHKRRALCAAKPCWRSKANTRSITIPRKRGRQGMQEEHPRLRFRRRLILPLIFSLTLGMTFHLQSKVFQIA